MLLLADFIIQYADNGLLGLVTEDISEEMTAVLREQWSEETGS
jgi:hypothetical protein